MSKISFKINGKEYEVDGKFGPDVSLNEFIRNVADLRGTKAMCQEGGCGVCVVAVRAAHPPDNEMRLFSVNSCLVSVLSCHGWEITTVEGVGSRTMGYHEIQTRLASFNGTQCGYCTPGWIMNMYCLYESKKNPTSLEIENSFASNICRCTGYRPIADAFKSLTIDADTKLIDKLVDVEDLGIIKACGVNCIERCHHKKDNIVKLNDADKKPDDDWCVIEKNNHKMIKIDCGNHKWFKTYSLDDVFEAINAGDYKLIAGNTGQGVYHVTEYPQNVIDIFDVFELKGYVLDVNLILGAGMPLTEMMDLFLILCSENEDFAYLKQLYEHMDLVAHIPVRNIGTIGGNLYMKYDNNEFQSDLFLLFETVGAMVTIAEGPKNTTTISLTDFLKINMKNKIIIMPRSQNAHAVVNAGFLFKFKQNSNVIEKAVLVYGSISPTFVHAIKTEAILVGKDPFTNETLQLAVKSLFDEIIPGKAPPEPSGAYRKMLAITLFYKAILTLCSDDKIDPRNRSGGDTIKRGTSQGTQIFDTDKSVWPLNQPVPKLEALVQCSGEATFANDLPKEIDEVFAAFVTADAPPGSVVKQCDPSEALKIPGVLAFYTAKDIPGDNSFTPLNVALIEMNEEILCSKELKYYGDPVGIIVADREKIAHKAAKLVKIEYTSINENKHLLTIDDVLKSKDKDKRTKTDRIIEPTDVGGDVKCIIYGEVSFETQHHFYMEPQTCVVKKTEDGLEVYSSTQWLDITNVAVAQCLKVPVNSVNVIVRRVGGGYGGKITRSSQIACAAALVTHLTGRTCRFILPMQTNMKIIGKRVPTYCNFQVAVNKDGVIQYMKNNFYQDNGCSSNETITPITANHFRSCYSSSRWYVEANSVITDTPSNTWCRAPSSTEGVAMIEYIMEKIAYHTGKDPLQVRLLNIAKDNNPIPELIEQLKKDSNFDERLEDVKKFNDANRWRKRALKLIPMTYELFYISPYNSLVSIYHADGSVVITHGCIEMGQGINTKTAQVCAYMLNIPLNKISVKPSSSFTSPNSMATGASIGSECVAYATMRACQTILERLKPIKEAMENAPWEDIVEKAYQTGIDLQASHMYSQNDGVKPYDIYGAVALEVEVDILTGNHDVRRVDLLEDTGRSLNPEIDVAQIEGAFVMGLGYWTSEKVIYDKDTGKILTDRTWNYKPPGIKDIPEDFRVYFRRNSKNPYGVLQSKATGEPAFCLAAVITHAFRETVRASRLDAGYQDQWIDIPNPCTVENIFMALGHKLEHFVLK
ncbi:xanthine dehydrogenase isoform X2 [Manduca sexta]|uniref:xanthine dehydrogenase isoform X2 n=1 Tax=Manduca sexta TaxID=7130 RepID=UPI00188FD9BD|nr:xanthine dehydrogenase isoform X2 [Manduca sexta]